MKIIRAPNIDALADRGGIAIATDGDVTFRIFAGSKILAVTKDTWTFPRFGVAGQTDTINFSAVKPENCGDRVDVTYTGLHSIRLICIQFNSIWIVLCRSSQACAAT